MCLLGNSSLSGNFPPSTIKLPPLQAMKDIRKDIHKEQRHNSIHSFTSTLHESDWSASHSGNLILTIELEAGWDPRSV